MKFFPAFFVILFTSMCLHAKQFSLPLYAEGAILINAKTGATLSSKNPDDPLYPASITKIATALYALKKRGGHLNEMVVVKRDAIASITPDAKRQSNYRAPPYWLETDATHAGLKKGEEILLKDLLYLMLIQSANDAANVIAEHVGGTIPKFMEGVNAYIRELGCTKTNFLNPHGLHHPDQVSTPREMAILAREAMRNPIFREIVATVRYTVPRTNLEFERPILQTNLLLRKGRYHYPGATGIKTGTTIAAGKTLVAGATQEGRDLIAVVMGCQKIGERYDDVIKMFDTAFKEQKLRRTLLAPGPCKLTKKVMGAKGGLKTLLPHGLYYDFYPSEEVPVKASVKWVIPKLPIVKGQSVGWVRIQDKKGQVLQEVPLLAASPLSPSLFYRIKFFFSGGGVVKALLVLAGSAALLFFLKKMRGRRGGSSSRRFS